MHALSPPANLKSIQALRGLAAMAVAAAHLYAVEGKFDAAPLLGAWAQAGFAGVDLFFVISGFVMVWVTGAIEGRPREVPRFLLARAIRIYPLWWLVLTAVVAVWIVRPAWVYASSAGAPDLLRSYLLLPAPSLPLHAVGWTLVHELWFYLVFAALLALPKGRAPIGLGFWAAVVFVAAALPAPADPVLRLIRHPLSLEFMFGCAVGLCARRGIFPAPRALVGLGLAVIVAGGASIVANPIAAFEGEWERVLKFGLPAAILIWGVVGMERAGVVAPRWSQHLGDWSYALYLIHVPVFAAAARASAGLSRGGAIDNLVFLVVAIAGAVGAAAVLHLGFDRPLQKAARRALVARSRG